MKKFAVIDMKSKWVLSIHGSRAYAEARLRAYVSGVLVNGTMAAVAPFLPPGTGAVGLIPHLRVVAVPANTRRAAYFTGEIREESATTAHRHTKKTA